MNKFIIQLLQNLLDFLNLAPCTEIALTIKISAPHINKSDQYWISTVKKNR